MLSDSGSFPLFRSLEAQILNAIPLDTCEWRRTFQRPTKHVRLEAQTQQFSVEPLERYKKGDWSILEHPILHIFVTECNVSRFLGVSVCKGDVNGADKREQQQ